MRGWKEPSAFFRVFVTYFVCVVVASLAHGTHVLQLFAQSIPSFFYLAFVRVFHDYHTPISKHCNFFTSIASCSPFLCWALFFTFQMLGALMKGNVFWESNKYLHKYQKIITFNVIFRKIHMWFSLVAVIVVFLTVLLLCSNMDWDPRTCATEMRN